MAGRCRRLMRSPTAPPPAAVMFGNTRSFNFANLAAESISGGRGLQDRPCRHRHRRHRRIDQRAYRAPARHRRGCSEHRRQGAQRFHQPRRRRLHARTLGHLLVRQREPDVRRGPERQLPETRQRVFGRRRSTTGTSTRGTPISPPIATSRRCSSTPTTRHISPATTRSLRPSTTHRRRDSCTAFPMTSATCSRTSSASASTASSPCSSCRSKVSRSRPTSRSRRARSSRIVASRPPGCSAADSITSCSTPTKRWRRRSCCTSSPAPPRTSATSSSTASRRTT